MPSLINRSFISPFFSFLLFDFHIQNRLSPFENFHFPPLPLLFALGAEKDCSLETLTQARKEEKKLLIEATKRVSSKETKGATWGEIIERWVYFHKCYPSKKFNIDTLNDHVSRMKKWTPHWLNRNASEITIGDSREVLREAYLNGASYNLRRAIKGTINVIFKWAIEENLVPNCNKSPAKDIELEGRSEEKMPEILNMQEIKQLLIKANQIDHPWYPVWKVGFLTGMRSSELEGLRKQDIELTDLNDPSNKAQISANMM